ncbi:MAG: hypothetical protein LBD23_19135 [Oscillospiraceae bacterium]|jgi:hypothetical protein|nr:hypothetical protein [Oscillospiraceae bacterium]
MLEDEVVKDEIAHYVFVKKGRRHFDPQYVGVETTLQWIFPVPEPNAVGTLDKYSNGIVFIKFGKYGTEPEREIVAQNFSKTVYGENFNYRFSPNFSEDIIAYCKTRIAVITNVKNSDTFHAECGLSMYDYMLGIRFLDQQENLFVVVKSIKIKNAYGRENYLQVVKLEGQELVDTGWSMKNGVTHRISSDFPLYNTWLVHNKNLFVYEREWNKILCTDGKQSILHPFSETYNANAGRIGKIKDFVIHPSLPFGVMIEERAVTGVRHGLIIVRWDTDDPDEQILAYVNMFNPLAQLFGFENMALAYQSFSPDRNWYIVGCIAPDEPKNPYFIALPVDGEQPDLLDRDDIVILGQVKNMTSLAWTSEPTAYVVSNGELLHKWDLDELPNARVFAAPRDDDEKEKSVFRRIGKLFGGRR